MPLLLQIASTTTESARPLGIGAGLFAMIFFGILFIIGAVIGKRTGNLLPVGGGLAALWLIIALILLLVPKLPAAQLAQQAQKEYDGITTPRIVIAIVMAIVMLGAIGAWVAFVALPPRYAIKPAKK